MSLWSKLRALGRSKGGGSKGDLESYGKRSDIARDGEASPSPPGRMSPNCHLDAHDSSVITPPAVFPQDPSYSTIVAETPVDDLPKEEGQSPGDDAHGEDESIVDHLSDPGVYFQPEQGGDVVFSKYYEAGECAPPSPGRQCDTEEGGELAKGDSSDSKARKAYDAASIHRVVSLSETSVENAAVWSRSVTNYTHDDDRSSLMHDVAASSHEYKGKGKEKARGRRDVFELWNGEEVEEEEEEEDEDEEEGEGVGNDHPLEDDSEDYEDDEEGEEEELNTHGFQFWHAAMQAKSLDGHGDEVGENGAGQSWQDGMYGSMWQNMTGHLETMKDDWAETQADRDSAAEQGDDGDVDSDSRASAMSDTALLDLQVPGSGQWQAPPWEGGGGGGESEEEEKEEAERYDVEQSGNKEDGQEGGDARGARDDAEGTNVSIADLSGYTAATREGRGDGGSGRLEYSVSQSDLPAHSQLGGLPGSFSKGVGEPMAVSTSRAAEEAIAGRSQATAAPGTDKQAGGAGGDGPQVANSTTLQLVQHEDKDWQSPVAGQVDAGCLQVVKSSEALSGSDAAAASAAAGVAAPLAMARQQEQAGDSTVDTTEAIAPIPLEGPFEASVPPRQLDPSLSGQARVHQWVILLSPDDCEPTEGIPHWSSISEVAGATGSATGPPSPPAPPNAGPALKPSSKSMSYSHLHYHPALPPSAVAMPAGAAGAAAAGTGLASAAAAAAEHASKTVKGVDRHAAALYLSMKGLHAVPPLLAFSCLKTLDLSRNSLTSVPAGALPRTLHILDLSHNKLWGVEGLRELTRLRVLNLGHNRIARIGHGLAGCVALREVYMGSNKIAEVEGLHRLLKLCVLDLSHNKMTSTKSLSQLAANYGSLRSLNLTGNPIHINLGDDAFKRYVTGLIPQLLYLNLRPLKAIATRDGLTDPSARKGLHHHSTRTGSSSRVGHRSGSSRRKATAGASTSGHHRSVSRPKTATGTHRTRGAAGADGVKSASRHHHRH